MKILSIGNFTTSWDGSICDEQHIASSLEQLGHEVYRWQRETSVSPDGPFDFVLIAQWHGYPDDFVDNLRRDYNCPIVYWAFDYQADGQVWHENLIRKVDLYLSKPLSDSKYPNWQWLPQDFAPINLKADWDNRPDKDIDVLFTGSYLPWALERIEILRGVDKMFNLVIHSFTPDEWRNDSFKDVRGPVMDNELNELIPRAKVHLSIDHTISPGYWSDRNAQLMACGGAVLFHYVPMSEVTFGDAVKYFYNAEDCLQQLEWMLSQDLTALEMYAWNYAQQNLMVTNRVQQLLTIVGAQL